jgi:integrase
MARTVRDARLETAEARKKLAVRGKPHWRMIEEGLHLGYRRLKGRAGTWVRRKYKGDQQYETDTIGTADDISDADGDLILSFKQAQDKARNRLVKSGPYTVNDAMADYLEFIENNRKSADDARCRYNVHIKALGDIEVASLTADQIRKWHTAIAKSPPRARSTNGVQNHRKPKGDGEDDRRRKASANRTLTTLKAALNMAYRNNKVPSRDEWGSRVERFESVEAARTRYLDISECKRLLNACEPDFRLLVRAGLETGARYGELIRLVVSDFNRDSETVAIRQSKTGKPRHIVLTEEGVKFFRELCAGRTGLMFTKASGGPWKKTDQAKRMILASERATIEPRIGFHGLRHTWASLGIMNGMPLMVAAKNLGHTDTKMVQEHYGHLAPDYIKDEIRKAAPRYGIKSDKKIVELA